MGINLKNKHFHRIIFILAIYMFSITILSVNDITKNKNFIKEEPYFKSNFFKEEIKWYFDNMKFVEFGFKEEIEKTQDNEKKEQLNILYKQSKSRIDLNPSLKYYIKDKKNNKIYTNIENLNDINQYIKDNAIHIEKFPCKDNSQTSFNNISSWFNKNNFEGSIIFVKTLQENTQMDKDYNYYNLVRKRVIKEIPIGVATLVLGMILLTILKLAYKEQKDYIKIRKRFELIPIDLRIIALVILGFTINSYLKSLNFFYKPINISQIVTVNIIAVALIYIMLNIDCIFRLILHKEDLKEQLSKSLFPSFVVLIKESVSVKGVLKKEVLLNLSSCFCGMCIVFSTDKSLGIIFFILIAIYLIIVPRYILRRVSSLNKIIKGTDDIVAGNLDYSIEQIKDKNYIKLSENINKMREVFKESLESQVKSERLKTELITNVSHDLKTPLTSIINYVNLLKSEDISHEDRKKYIDILERKSERLKVLIEDLFEASKASSGAMELNIEKIDIAVLLQQSLGEFEDKIANSSLTFRTSIPREEVYLNLDGKKTWRVFENLIGNALKYSQSDSRVYITLREYDEKVQFIIKNMSSYEMDFDVNEIFERFKRGDKARTTEGSGLGLSIAKSLVELQGGHMAIDIDGDLFKVILEFPLT